MLGGLDQGGVLSLQDLRTHGAVDHIVCSLAHLHFVGEIAKPLKHPAIGLGVDLRFRRNGGQQARNQRIARGIAKHLCSHVRIDAILREHAVLAIAQALPVNARYVRVARLEQVDVELVSPGYGLAIGRDAAPQEAAGDVDRAGHHLGGDLCTHQLALVGIVALHVAQDARTCA